MSGAIVNLRRARKARGRTQRDAVAVANRLEHGRSRAEREATAVQAERVERLLDGHRLAGDGQED